jgi:hypothetical protein
VKKKLFYGIYLLGFVLIVFGAIELYLSHIINNPKKCPLSWEKNLDSYYNECERSVIQYESEMAQYDTGLFYTLKPGNFVFENSEFKTPYMVNSMGCRDDESSLNKPKIVMVGDSYGMGWGVNQDETYANLVEKEINTPVLNMGISSYGTPREMRFLERVNTDSLEYLIIQHCPNDYGEIVQYLWKDNNLVVSNKNVYDSIANIATANKSYYPFKRTVEFLPTLLGREKEVEIDSINYPKVPQFNIFKGFLDIIRSTKNIPKHTKIIVFTIGVKGFSNDFMKSVEATLDKEFSSSLHDRITFLDFSKVLKPENYFVLDAHINASGHKIIAETLTKYINSKPRGAFQKAWHYENGNISIKASYYNHYKQGLATYYWPNGNKSLEVSYVKGEKEGIEIRFNKKGEEIERKNYSKGIEL